MLLESLAAIGCVLLLWSLFGHLLRPKAALPAVLVLPVSQAADGLEQTLGWVRFLEKRGLFRGPVLVLDQGVCYKRETLNALLQEQGIVLRPEELERYFTKERE